MFEKEHFASPLSDLDRTASQTEFGHPYAFVGIPGTGTPVRAKAISCWRGVFCTGHPVVLADGRETDYSTWSQLRFGGMHGSFAKKPVLG